MKKLILSLALASLALVTAAFAQAQNSGLSWLLFSDILGVAFGIVALAYSFKNQKKYRGGIIGKSHSYINIALTLFMASFIWHIMDYKGLLPNSPITGIMPSLVASVGVIFIALASKIYSEAFERMHKP